LSEFLGSFRTDFGSVSQSNSGGDTRTTTAIGRIAITDNAIIDYTTADYTATD
jgi:hypothetical protein